MPSALITGVGGQDGAYLARLLLEKNYRVSGTIRPRDDAKISLRALQIEGDIEFIEADLCDAASLRRAIEVAAPDEIYNLAAHSSVSYSLQHPTQSGDVNGLGVARLLEAMREVRPDARFFQASSSEMFGQSRHSPQNEETPFEPRNPYAAAKTYAHNITATYRVAFGCHAGCGILFNHESPLRPIQFATRKVTTAVARIKIGLQDSLSLGNLDVERDWGFAGDYVRAMWMMLQRDTPDDYVIANGETHSLREFVARAFACADLDYQQYVRIDPAFFRPAEVTTVKGDNSRARLQLGWSPSVQFGRLVEFLVEAEMRRARGEEESIQYLMETA